MSAPAPPHSPPLPHPRFTWPYLHPPPPCAPLLPQKYNLPYPHAVFEMSFFRKNPRPFFLLAKVGA